MLTQLYIRDFAIIEQLELSLGAGMGVLTGETGAGKSILVDALGLVLGDRADSDTVRHGAGKAEIAVTVDIRDLPDVSIWLDEHDLDRDNECILRRVVARDGRSRAYVNGSPVSLAVLRSLGETLVDIHGQHEHQSLLRRDTPRELLDRHAGNGELLARIASLHRRRNDLEQTLEQLTSEQDERRAKMALLQYQVEELGALNLASGETSQLDEEHQRLAHAEELKREAYAAYQQLYELEDGALHSQVGRIMMRIGEYAQWDDKLTDVVDLLGGAQAQLEEAASQLRHYSDSLEVSPNRLEWVEERIASIHDLARKHQIQPVQLPEHLAGLQAELSALTDPDRDLAHLRDELERVHTEYHTLALQIREQRLAAATALNRDVTAAMQDLGMRGGRFDIEVHPLEEGAFSATGLDHVQFLVCTNPGHPLQPLAKIASGGELSRISLAIQVVAARDTSIPTLIFDEVDSGVGGAVAEVVGRQLRKLGGHHQVLCVTHLPQVAAQAHHHYRVTKKKERAVTTTEIAPLNADERIEEVARMLGGVKLTDQTRAHAAEMITQAQSP